ncbi:hypothetical protein Pan97_23370 [Bremerella volcania]|uniref:RHS repeat-associated core domain-containing protein n=1 Tax=Bremerella volcania TaxID=2527984 RepID=A0A518C7V0_9BACT|nr:RHS repeat-associated core domain-containing protein [Bremerella volcania]QDU75307.1 hypothetical protein Pan97_23370 [Bremerella volcania]
MFDPTIGRWISEDPIGFEAADENLQRYVGNNPINSTDPSGLQKAGDLGLGEFSETLFETTYNEEFWISIGRGKNITIPEGAEKDELFEKAFAKKYDLEVGEILLSDPTTHKFTPTSKHYKIHQRKFGFNDRLMAHLISFDFTDIRYVYEIVSVRNNPANSKEDICRYKIIDRLARVKTSVWAGYIFKDNQKGRGETRDQLFFDTLEPFSQPEKIKDHYWWRLKHYPDLRILPGYNGNIKFENFQQAFPYVKPPSKK